MLPFDLNNIIIAFAGIRIPTKTIEAMDAISMEWWNLITFHMKVLWSGLGWSPTNCNKLIMVKSQSGKSLESCRYSAVTGLTPTLKERIEIERSEKGLHPIWPGDRHYPTSRVRFDPKIHVNDRYFR